MVTPKQSPVTIRDAKPSDGNAINKLCIAAFEEFRPIIGEANWRQLRETLAHTSKLASEGELIVAEDSSDLLGLVLYIPPHRDQSDSSKSAWLQTLAVSPLHRGKGIGHSLTRECINRARKDGADAIALTTAEMMTVARPMYERMGFIKESDLGKRLGVRHARYVLRLK